MEVCLSSFTSSTAADSVQNQTARQMAMQNYPPSATPSSVPASLTVPGVPGVAARFLDLSTVGQENISFAKGNILAAFVVLCSPSGGQSCAIGLSMAQEQYLKIPELY